MKSNKGEKYNDFNELFDGSKKDISEYIEKRLSLTKLKAYEKIANFSSRMLYGIVMFVFALILSILLVITAGLFLGHLLHNHSQGFGIVFLVFIVTMILIALNKKRVRRFFVNKTLRTIKKIESDEE